ncbi:LuxR C-terminal-related transcriptional regulator [Paenibacillus sp. CF384]|uniref:LuxR C-terminal-related transcriptional regulator n=1 Tax=Paenibacillus sp. CF384 TaxID=1884382 RepID=UPI0008982198|nr:LuxR C-terminal-related transcriptional regulator [Paenibacillus sp. CF384]SDX39653.1 AAA ATPase domain-containing protein [Paenibacillus sp. CF384]
MSIQEELPPAGSRSIEQLERHYFVGRKNEIRLFRKRLKERSPKGRILNIHGTGGAGKSFLLTEFRRLAERADARFVLMDCRTMPRNPGEFCLYLHRLIEPNARKTRRRSADPSLQKDNCVKAIREAAAKQKLILAFDTFEEIGELEHWMREFIAGTDPAVLVIISGRFPLRGEWQSSPAWNQLIERLPIAELNYEDIRSYLKRLDHELQEEGIHYIWSMSKGHPLTLSLLASALHSSRKQQTHFVDEDVFDQVVDIWLKEVPDSPMRELVEAVAVLRHFNQDLITFALQREVSASQFKALINYSFVQRSGHGWLLHDLLRDAIHRQMRLRAPDYCDRLWKRCIRYYYQTLKRSNDPLMRENEDWFYYLGDQLIRSLFFHQPSSFSLEELSPANWADAVAYMENRYLTAKTTKLSLLHPETREKTEFLLTRQHSLYGLKHIQLDELYQLDPTIVKLVRNASGAIIGLTAIIPINSQTLDYLCTKPLSAAFFSGLPESALRKLRVESPFMAGYFVKTLDAYDYADPVMMQASGLILINHLISSGYVVASPPPLPISRAIFESLGCERDTEPVIHHDYDEDAPAPVFVVDLRGHKRQAYLDRMAALSGISDRSTEETIDVNLLTGREKEVLALLMDGRSNLEIAAKLYLSETTVKKHLSHIYEKLEVRNRKQLMSKAGRMVST